MTPYRAKFCLLLVACLMMAAMVEVSWRHAWDCFRSLGSAQPATVAELCAQTAPPSLHVSASGLQRIGQPQILGEDGETKVGYVRVGDGQSHPFELVLYKPDLTSVAELDRFLAGNNIEGYLTSQCSRKRSRRIRDQFPELIDRPIRLLATDANPPKKRLAALGVAASVGLSLILYALFFLVQEYRKQRRFEEKRHEDRDPEYCNSPNAMRLVGRKGSPAASSSPLLVDPFYQVPTYEPRKAARFGQMQIVSILGIAWLAGFIAYKYSVTTPPTWIVLPYFTGIWLGGIVWLNKTKRNQATLSEQPMDEASAVFTRTSWHRYHECVLRELGFQRVTISRALGVTVVQCRSIYLSRNHAVLVELGMLCGSEYFSVESLLNDGRCIQTFHALAFSQGSNSIPPTALVRCSAYKKSLLESFEIHANKIGEMTEGSNVMVATIKPDNYANFMTHAHELTLARPARV